MHLERPGTWLHGGSVDRDVGFFSDMPQLPPEHGGCCRRGGACLKTACTSDVVTSQKSMHCTVTSLLLCSFSSSLIVSSHSSRWVFVFLMPPSKRFFSGLSSLTGWLQVHLQQFRDQGHLLHRRCFDPFVLGRLFLQRGLFQLPLGSVVIVLQQIQFGVSLHLLAGVLPLLFGHQPPLYGVDQEVSTSPLGSCR